MYVAVLSYNIADKIGKLFLTQWNQIWQEYITVSQYPKEFTPEESREFTQKYKMCKREEKVVGMKVKTLWWKGGHDIKGIPVKIVNAFYTSDEILTEYFGVRNDFAQEDSCPKCGSPLRVIWVAGHGQCENCKQNILPCCDGERCDE